MKIKKDEMGTLGTQAIVDVFIPRSVNIQFLKALYKLHILAGLPLGLIMIIYPQLLLSGEVLGDSGLAALRSYGCTLLSFCTILYKFGTYDRVKHHRGMAKALLVLHVTGFIVFFSIFIYELLGHETYVYESQFLVGVILHSLFLTAILIKPGYKWIRKADGHQHVSFQHQSLLNSEALRSEMYGSSPFTPVQLSIENYYQAEDLDERREAIQELWDRLNEDQSGVLGASQCEKLIKEFSLFEKQTYIELMRKLKPIFSLLPSFVRIEAERLAWSSVRRVDKFLVDIETNPDIYIEKLMSQMDVDGDGQVDKREFYEMAEKIIFDSFRPLGGVNSWSSQNSGCPIQ